MDTDDLIKAIAAGFDALQVEYQKLHGQHQTLERRLSAAREQYHELAKLCNTSGALSTPPLSLSSSDIPLETHTLPTQSAADILERQSTSESHDAASKVRKASQALSTYQRRIAREATHASGVKIWSGRSADDVRPMNKFMPAVAESPLEQDFTIEGVPSRLGCPFASMAQKKLSSHAASVLSRYRTGSVGAASSTPVSATSRINGRDSFARRNGVQQQQQQPANLVDPIKAEICGLSDHDQESPHSERAALKNHIDKQNEAEAEVGVCPIRFLDQHSPEEVATYFENHKHELPRSHEVCVKRYQSNEKQIQELDAKYGNLVTMIQGLGAKHKDMLPEEPVDDEDDDDEAAEPADVDAKSAAKVMQWANSVSARAMNGRDDDDDEKIADMADGDEEERRPHFERPLRDIRVGESPSRPWGISVPVQYLDRQQSYVSSLPAPPDTALRKAAEDTNGNANATAEAKNDAPPRTGKCPFDFGARKQTAPAAQPPSAPEAVTLPVPADTKAPPDATAAPLNPHDTPKPIFIATPIQPTAQDHLTVPRPRERKARAPATTTVPAADVQQPNEPTRMVFTGPVFIGYSPEDAAKFLKHAGGLGGM